MTSCVVILYATPSHEAGHGANPLAGGHRWLSPRRIFSLAGIRSGSTGIGRSPPAGTAGVDRADAGAEPRTDSEMRRNAASAGSMLASSASTVSPVTISGTTSGCARNTSSRMTETSVDGASGVAAAGEGASVGFAGCADSPASNACWSVSSVMTVLQVACPSSG